MNTDVVTDTGSGSSVFTNIDTTGGTLPATPANCVTSTCTSPSQIYSFLVYDWVRRVGTQFPGGVVKVCRDSNPKDANGVYRWACTPPATGTGLLTIKIGWTARNDKGEGTFVQAGTDVNPPQFVVTVYGSQQDIVSCGGATTC